MLKSYKYRLYPTPNQKKKIDQTIDVCRLIYNLGLEIKKYSWDTQKKSISCYELGRQLSGLRAEYPFIAEVNSQALHDTLNKLDNAFGAFFKGAGYPKFKSKRSQKQAFRCHNGRRQIDWINSTISIPKIEHIPLVLSRSFEGKIKTIAISRTCTGKYFASVLVESNNSIVEMPKQINAIGIDLGIATFATLSTGEKIATDKYLAQSIKRLKVLQRRTSRKKKGSGNRKKANKKVALLHEKIANQRKDTLHKVSTRLIRDSQTDTICVETLAVKSMVKNHKLAQAISDVSWSEFIRQLEYKGKWYGKNIIKIDRWYASSKTCSNCGHKLDDLDLSIRGWTCSSCNSIHDRDINAAINIRNSGMGSPGEPVESPTIVGAKKQEFASAKCQVYYLML